jgi:hypothetical protein
VQCGLVRHVSAPFADASSTVEYPQPFGFCSACPDFMLGMLLLLLLLPHASAGESDMQSAQL